MKRALLLATLCCLPLAGTAGADVDDMSGIGDLRGDERIVHVLNRLGYSPGGDVERIREHGLYRTIVEQLHPERIDDLECDKRLEPFELFRLTAAELERERPPLSKEERQKLAELQKRIAAAKAQDGASKEGIRELQRELRVLRERNDRNKPLIELARAKVIRAVHSDRQLEQVMVDFWFNHFNVFGRKGPASYLIPEFEEHVLRPRAFGKFHDLLVAVAKSPAMLYYLDNWMSAAPEGAPVLRPGKSSPRRRGGRRGLNENYARELLELHTVGVDNGYDQKDIIETARCFTGWTIAGGGRNGRAFEFLAGLHDAGTKRVMGMRIPGGRGVEDGDMVLEMLAHHPNTAWFISEKLCRRFVADEPPLSLVERCAGTYLDSGGDIRLVLYRIFTSPEFFSREYVRQKMKKPLEYAVSAIRAVGAETDGHPNLLRQIGVMGEALYLCEPPTGYPDVAEKWAGSNAMLGRVNFATALAFGRVPGAKPDFKAILEGGHVEDPRSAVDWLCKTYVGTPLSEPSERALLKAVEEVQQKLAAEQRRAKPREGLGFLTSLILGSPDFQMR